MTGDRLVEAAAVADRLGVPLSWVRSATRTGQLPCIRLGRWVRYDPADIDEWIQAQKHGRSKIRKGAS